MSRAKIPKTGTPIRDSVEFLRNLPEYHKRLYKQGPVVNSGLSLTRAIMLLGPDSNEFVFKNVEQAFSSEVGWELILKRLFPGSVMALDGSHHRYQRRIMNHAFKKEVLVSYLEALNVQTDRMVKAWQPSQSFSVFNHIKELTLDLASHVFMGVDLDDNSTKVKDSFIHMVEAAVTPIRYPIPFTPMWKGVKGREFMVKYFEELLPKKRGPETPDFFSQFCHAVSEDNEKFTDKEIVDHMAFLLMAAHDTTTSTLTALFYFLAKHPDWQERVREESLARNKLYLDFDDIDKMETISLVLDETLRMFPPLPAVIRGVVKDIEYKDYLIPAGNMVGVSPIHTHYLPEIWTQPDTFDPMRFSDERKEHKAHAYAYVPFGGGAHKCLGQKFAKMQIVSIVHQVVHRYKWSVDSSYTMPYQFVPIGKPRDGLPVKFEKIAA